MSERKRLVELIDDFGDDVSLCDVCSRPREDCEGCTNEQLAEYLLENGVIVPPVKVGDTVYEIQQDRTLQKWYVYGIIKYDGQEWAAKAKNNKNKWNYIDKTFAFRLSGKTVFLTKKSAEKALKGGAE